MRARCSQPSAAARAAPRGGCRCTRGTAKRGPPRSWPLRQRRAGARVLAEASLATPRPSDVPLAPVTHPAAALALPRRRPHLSHSRLPLQARAVRARGWYGGPRSREPNGTSSSLVAARTSVLCRLATGAGRQARGRCRDDRHAARAPPPRLAENTAEAPTRRPQEPRNRAAPLLAPQRFRSAPRCTYLARDHR
eukprot:scaffold18864_cov68-Phaeocystis_antarctica.AAC.5